jgi:serine/threonine kinase 16
MLYRAPELHQVRTYSSLDEKTDVWSLGCILYFMVFGESPFAGVQRHGDSIVLATMNESYTFPSRRVTTPKLLLLEDLIRTMLKSDPIERPSLKCIIEKLGTA